MKIESKKNLNKIQNQDLNLFHLYDETLNYKKLIFISTFIGFLVSLIILSFQKEYYELNLEVKNLPKNSLISDSNIKLSPLNNISFSFIDEFYSEAINYKVMNAQNSDQNNLKISIIGDKEQEFININITGDNSNNIKNYAHNLLKNSNSGVNTKLNLMLSSYLKNLKSYVENANELIEKLSSDMSSVGQNSLFASIVQDRSILYQRKYEAMHTVELYKQMILASEKSQYTNFVAVNHNTEFSVEHVKVESYIVILSCVLFGFIIGIFLSVLMILRIRSI